MSTSKARRETIEFFERVPFDAPRAGPHIWKLVPSSDEARELQSEFLASGPHFIDLKEIALSGYIRCMGGGEYRGINRFARDVAEEAAYSSPIPEGSPFELWLPDIEGDALGIFYSLLFPQATESNEFFALVRKGYESGGVPCGVPEWPSDEIAIFTGEIE